MRIPATAGATQMHAKKIEQSFHAALVHRGKTPGAAGEGRLALVISVASYDFDRLNRNA